MINNAQDVGSWHIGTQRHWYAMKLLAACAIGDLLKDVLYLSSFFFGGGNQIYGSKIPQNPPSNEHFFSMNETRHNELTVSEEYCPFCPL